MYSAWTSADTEKVRALGWQQKVHLDQHIGEFLQSAQRSASIEKRVLVFSTTFVTDKPPVGSGTVTAATGWLFATSLVSVENMSDYGYKTYVFVGGCYPAN